MGTKRKLKPPVDDAQLRESMLAAIAGAERPLTAKELGKSGPKVKALLAEALSEGRVFAFGAAYSNRSPVEVARERLLEIASVEALARGVLKKRAMAGVPGLNAKAVDAALKALLEAKRFVEHSKLLVDIRHPEPYLEAEIGKLLERFEVARTPRQIRALLADEAGGVVGQNVEETAGKLFEAIQRTAFSPGAAVTFYKLRQVPELAGIPKDVFDAAALRLQAERKALLSVHDHAAGLPEAERERFVTDGQGKFYVSIYVR